MSDDGQISIVFGRPIVYPTELMILYDKDYVEAIPELVPTDEELEELQGVF